MKKNYIIVGDNDFWYAVINDVTDAELQEQIEEVKAGIKNNDYQTPMEVSTLFVYEVSARTVIELPEAISA